MSSKEIIYKIHKDAGIDVNGSNEWDIKINNDKIVETVIVTDQDYINRLKNSLNWIETSYTGDFRKNYAGINITWDESRNAFIEPKLHYSWVLNESTCRYDPPTAYPDDGKRYDWNESTTSWDEIE